MTSVEALRDGDEDEAVAFVESLYRSILGRPSDEDGLAHHAARLRDGVTREQLIAHFLSCSEYQERNVARVEAMLATRAAHGVLPPRFPLDYQPPGEAGRCYRERVQSGFFHRYCGGPTVLDIGFSGYDNPDCKTALPDAIGVDTDYPGYDGRTLPFADGSIDTVFSSHCLEHILYEHAAIRDWYRVLRTGGFIVCIVPSQALYEKRRFLPSRWNEDHKRMYTPASLAAAFEYALEVNSFRVRHLAENDAGFNYALGPDVHSDGAYEIEIVVEKIVPPAWKLA